MRMAIPATPLTLRARNNPRRPADEQKTAKAADQLVRRGNLFQQDKGADTGDPQQVHHTKGKKETHQCPTAAETVAAVLQSHLEAPP